MFHSIRIKVSNMKILYCYLLLLFEPANAFCLCIVPVISELLKAYQQERLCGRKRSFKVTHSYRNTVTHSGTAAFAPAILISKWC